MRENKSGKEPNPRLATGVKLRKKKLKPYGINAAAAVREKEEKNGRRRRRKK